MALAHAILAVLIGNPCSGYDLRKSFESSVGFFWRATFQQVYRELAKLEEQGLLSAETIHQYQRPDKRIYCVTPTGQQYLEDWIAQTAPVSPIKDDLLVKLFVGHLVPRAVILGELEQHRQAHLEQLATYEFIAQKYFLEFDQLSPPRKFQYLTLRNGIYYEQAWLAWCSETISFLNGCCTSEGLTQNFLRPSP
ncbi:MAG: PadR family transcriptional regulator [Pseudanabaenaceae cyanobacterium bins.68]|nr:PadR family transcriptional regulator [Pseudanabaenaceae cyanobacterium bins.68]